jgi:hypothetical protein
MTIEYFEDNIIMREVIDLFLALKKLKQFPESAHEKKKYLLLYYSTI